MRTIDRSWGTDGVGRRLVLAAGIVVWALSLHPIDAADLTDIGLISALPPSWWFAVGLVTLCFALAWLADPVDVGAGVLAAVTIAVILYGTPAAIEPLPRFNTVYVHIGLIEAIQRTGTLFPDVDARFSWPLFFVAVGAIASAGDIDLLVVAAWIPLLTTLVALPAMWILVRAFTNDARLLLLSTWILVVANWVGQDYLSPQGFNFVIYLWFLALVAWYFGRQGPQWLELRRRPPLRVVLGEPQDPPPVGADAHPHAVRTSVLLILAAFAAISATSHQLTPFAMIGSAAALLVVGRTRLRWLPVLVSVLAGLWIVFAGYTFLAGHLEGLVADIGNPSGAAGAGVLDRVRGSDGHLFVVFERIAFTFVFWAVAAFGAVRRVRAGHLDVAAVVLAAFPFGLIALASYGGEIFLRVFLFALPAMSFLAAAAIAPPAIARWARASILVAATLVLVAGFVVGRYGNELADLVTPAELEVVDRTHALAPPGSVVALLNYNTPLLYRNFEQYDSITITSPATGLDAEEIARQLDAARGDRPTFLLVTRGQEALRFLLGTTDAERDALRADLAASPRFIREAETTDGILYRYVPAVQR